MVPKARFIALAASATIAAGMALPAYGADIITVINAKLAQKADGESVHISKRVARHLYMENVSLRSHGVDFLNGCAEQNIDKHRHLSADAFPVTHYKDIPIVASPYHSVPIKTGKDNNAVYFQRLSAALNIIEATQPDTFAAIRNTVKINKGYIIIDNMCPSKSGLAYAAFVPRPKLDRFVVMVSSTLLLKDDLFSPYDIAAQLIHEIEGHAIDYYNRGTTDEVHAFTQQAAFAARVGDDKFTDANNRAGNIQAKIRLKLSSTGTYVDSKSN